jgi:hypothetical protein
MAPNAECSVQIADLAARTEIEEAGRAAYRVPGVRCSGCTEEPDKVKGQLG